MLEFVVKIDLLDESVSFFFAEKLENETLWEKLSAQMEIAIKRFG